MVANQDEVNNLNKMIDEIMHDDVEAVEEAQPETQPEKEVNAEEGNQPEEDEQPERAEIEEEKDFISLEAKELWNKVMFDKDFVCERGFGKVISLFSEVITKRGWEFFCEHKAPGFSALPREFYANMVGMKDDSVFVRGVWVPFDDRSINEMFKLRDYKHGSKYKKLLESPNYKKMLNLMKEKEKEMENSMLRKIDGFKHIYKELFKEFEKIMKERDQQLENDEEYRRKAWLESMDLINQNLSKLLECIFEVERTVNQVGERQDTLIHAVQISHETSAKGKGISPALEKKKAEIKFPKFDPSEASFDVDPPNIIPKRVYKKRKRN